MKKSINRILAGFLSSSMLCTGLTEVAAAEHGMGTNVPEVTLRVCNWEEYIDLGDWDEEETIDLESGDIIGENLSLIHI